MDNCAWPQCILFGYVKGITLSAQACPLWCLGSLMSKGYQQARASQASSSISDFLFKIFCYGLR